LKVQFGAMLLDTKEEIKIDDYIPTTLFSI
jgi:hypothetical protein